MSQSAGSTYFQDAGIISRNPLVAGHNSTGVLRGVILAASGVYITMSSSLAVQNNFDSLTDKLALNTFDTTVATTNALKGHHIGDVGTNDNGTIDTSTQEFTLFLNGMKDAAKRTKVLSFDPQNDSYFAKQLKFNR